MNRPALLAVALLPLLGGCISSTCDYPTVTLKWSLEDISGASWKCGPAGVSTVDIYIGDAPVVTRPCADYGAVIDVSAFAPGVYPVVVEGIGADFYIYDRSRPFDVTVGECGDSYAAPVLGEALLDVAYGFSPTNVCHGGFMWYALWDEVAGFYISVVDAASGAYRDDYDCPGQVKPLQFSVPFGTYTLAWIQEVVDPLVTAVPVQQACVQPSVDVTGSGTTLYPVTLVDNTVTPLVCPAYP